jgi:hypothetical protein
MVGSVSGLRRGKDAIARGLVSVRAAGEIGQML